MTEHLEIPLVNFELKGISSMTLEAAKILPIDRTRLPPFEGCSYVLQIKQRDSLERRTLDRALTVFKLFSDSLITADTIFSDGEQIDRLRHYENWHDQEHRAKTVYSIAKTESNRFRTFWKRHIELPPENFAVYRFHLADYRAYSADRYVDHVESLEFLLVPDGRSGGISYKLGSRGAMILGGADADKRRKVFEDLRSAYSRRSKIVHGGRHNTPQKEWETLTSVIRESNRRVLVLMSENGLVTDKSAREKWLLHATVFRD